MKTLFKYILVVFCLGLMVLPACQDSPSIDAPYKALIITGQNNHTWEESTPILKQILDDTELFATFIAKSPAKGEDMSSFTPKFVDYDLIVLDYNGDSWPEETKTSFVDYVKGGGGVLVYHAADNSFADWPEYNEIIGLGGWGGRTEKDGPYLRWKDEQIVRDMTPGRGGSHGQQHAFVVKTRVAEHPIMVGIPDQWLHAKDELYSELRGPAKNLTVLATAYADTAKGGSGEHEPALMTIQYGQGRVFHTTLGHVGGTGAHPAAACVGFIVTLQRGAEWAVSGEVTQEIPDAFPGVRTVSLWEKYRPFTIEELLECYKHYVPGDSRTCQEDLKAMIREVSDFPEEMLAMEKELLKFVKSDATSASKNFILQELSVFGSEKAIKVLEQLAEEEDTQEMARFAIERIKSSYTNN